MSAQPVTLSTVSEYLAACLWVSLWDSQFDTRGVYRGSPTTQEETDRRNALRSAVEVFEFSANPPDAYFLYVKPRAEWSSLGNATTWTGQNLGECHLGSVFRSCFGDKRRALRLYAVNGFVYVGTYFCGAGDYARVKLSKRKGQPVRWRQEGAQ